jgi:eukaryotic-like serine/threonine-protein kinase
MHDPMAQSKPDEAAIFNRARQLDDPAARRKYLDEACRESPTLRRRIEALLRVHDEQRGFLELPAVTEGSVTNGGGESPGKEVGPYKLLEKLGEGGFGVVFLAEQAHPMRRKVALKILKPGMDTAQIVARFEAERQALALMDHPNIAHVLDGGATDSGRPYFVMELVHGVPLTRFCDEHKLALDQRLRLFGVICKAVQHAHQKGVIHRDLKPTNVLVALVDGQPVPKLIDFGVAKAMGQPLTERTLVTGIGSLVGTLEYMSPEQACIDAQDIDTRADIYSLGVLLYELLTGSTPLKHERIKSAAVNEALRLIREEDPPKPSSRLSESKDTLASISACRNLEPARLTRTLRGDLDWIVLKALEKDRNRRYPSPESLADDVDRYLRGEAIMARPPSRSYRFGKFARRHRMALALAAAVTLTLCAGTFVSAWFAIAATSAARLALRSAEAEKLANNEARAKTAETQAVLEFVQKRILAAARPEGRAGGLGHDVSLRKALKVALTSVQDSFVQKPLIEASVRRTLGESFLMLGEPKTASEEFLKARAIYSKVLGKDDVETLRCSNNLVASYRAMHLAAEALKLGEEQLVSCTEILGPDHAEALASMQNLATIYADLGHYPKSLPLREKVLEIRQAKLGLDHADTIRAMNNLANTVSALGRNEDALKLDQKAFALLEAKFGADHTETLDCRNNLALSYAAVGRFAEALQFQEGTLELYKIKFGPRHPSTLNCMHNVAKALSDLEQYDKAVEMLQKTLVLQKSELRPGHPDTIQTIYSLANQFGRLNRYDDALRMHREAFELRKSELGENHRDTLYSMWGVALNLLNLDRATEALPIIDDCLRRAVGDAADSRFFGLADRRLSHFEKLKDAAGCRATAEIWESLEYTDAQSLFHAARYRAVAAGVLRAADPSPQAAELANADANQAMKWLRKAATAGFKDAAEMKENQDLACLRERADFQQLLAEITAHKNPPGK